MTPNKSPAPTAVGAVSSAVAVHVANRRWLSFLRWVSFAHRMYMLFLFPLLFLLTGCATQRGHPKVEFHGTNGVTIPVEEWSGGHGHVPVVRFSKDGVVGRFIVDTGASVSMFTMTAVRAWHLSASDVPNSLHLADGSRFNTKFVKSVTLVLERTPIRVHFDEAYVLPGDLPYYGLIGYDFLKATHAVIDIDKSNITFSQ